LPAIHNFFLESPEFNLKYDRQSNPRMMTVNDQKAGPEEKQFRARFGFWYMELWNQHVLYFGDYL